jgi:hypothetical protein
MHDPVDDRDALLPRRDRVLRPRHVERALVERADYGKAWEDST